MSTNYKKLFFGNQIEVTKLMMLLNEVKIQPIIKDRSESARLAGFGNTMPLVQEVLVHADEYELALKILKNNF